MPSLAVKYRPSTFEECCGQESVIKILNRQIELNQVKNCYLFAGASGAGKTTLARILANKVNNGIGFPIEIDAASNNGVDKIRELVRQASERAIDGEYKVIIIDECHVLTKQAWDAFLKCIEEPPKYTIFIFCTTDPQKIPPAILNRVMRFNISRLHPEVIRDRLNYICECEGVINYKDSTDYISKICGGGMRDAISILEKAIDFSNDLSLANVYYALGSVTIDTQFALLNALIDGDEGAVLNIINEVYYLGIDFKLFIEQMTSFCLDVYKYSVFKEISLTEIPISYTDILNRTVALEGANDFFNYIMSNMLTIKNKIKDDVDIKSTIEIELIRVARLG